MAYSLTTGNVHYVLAMPWPRRRRLYLIENLAFLAILVIGLVLVFTISALRGRVIVAGCLATVMLVYSILGLTYFRNVLPELQEERERRRSPGGLPVPEDESDILWEDELVAIQSDRERYVFVALIAFAGLLSCLGIVVGLLAPHPRTSFEAFASSLCAGSLWFVVIETAVLWWTLRSRWAADHPHARFVPVAISGGGLLLLILMIDLMALGAITGSLNSWSWAMLGIVLVVTMTLLIWEVLAFRRTILDGAWRRAG